MKNEDFVSCISELIQAGIALFRAIACVVSTGFSIVYQFVANVLGLK